MTATARLEPFSFDIRLSPEAVDDFIALSPREQGWLRGGLAQSGERQLAWLTSDSVEAPHDLWVLHQWDTPSQTMRILRLGYFPIYRPVALHWRPPDAAVRDLLGEFLPVYLRGSLDEERWDNEGGR